MPDQNRAVKVHWGQHKEELSHSPRLNNVILRWAMTVGICLMVWTVLSPLIYEQFYLTAAKSGNFMNWLFWLACFLSPLLLVALSSTRKAIIKTREQYFPSPNTDNAALPVRQTLVRASSEPGQEQRAVLLRAAAERQETPPEQLLRAVKEPK